MANVKSHVESAERAISGEQIIGAITSRVNWIACLVIFIMMAFVFYDVIARYLGHPAPGSNDITQTLSVIAIPFAMGYTLFLKRHPATSFLVNHFPRKVQEYIKVITTFLSLVPFVFLIWSSVMLAGRMSASNEGTMTLGIPLAPQVYCITFGAVIMCLVLTLHFVESLRKLV